MAMDKRHQAYLMFAGGALVIVVIVAWNVLLSHRAKPDEYGCFGQPRRSTVIVLDQTDGLATQTQAEIYRRVQAVVNDDNQVHVGERVSVFTVDDLTRHNLKPQFEHCKPRATGSELTENPRAIAARKKKEFDEPLRRALAISIEGSAQSPIAEAISDLSRTQYLRVPEGARLLVYSDLLQHTPAVSLYRCTSGEQAIAAFKAARAGAVQRPTFRSAKVILNPVPRGGLSEQNVQCRAIFWNWFFGDNTGPGAGVELDPLPGPV